MVPAQAVQTGQKGRYLFVIKPDMTAELRVVKPGITVNDETVIEEGLKAGENVVTDGHLRHLPVVEGERLLGLLSIGDLVKETLAEQDGLIQHLEQYIRGE